MGFETAVAAAGSLISGSANKGKVQAMAVELRGIGRVLLVCLVREARRVPTNSGSRVADFRAATLPA
jgi:hypothetical protein